MNEIVERGPAQLAAMGVTPMGLIAQALANGASVETLNGLYDLQLRWEANEARKAFVAAKVAFKAETIQITKNKHVKFSHAKGETEYDHATLDNVIAQIGPALSKHGLSLDWKTDNLDGGIIRVTAILTHLAGHSEQTSLQGAPDQSGGKNAIQAVASTVTYLERHTALAITGLATKDQDNDGAGGADSHHAMFITSDQLAEIQDGLAEVDADIAKFCEWLHVAALAELPVAGFKKAMDAIEAKRKARAGKKGAGK